MAKEVEKTEGEVEVSTRLAKAAELMQKAATDMANRENILKDVEGILSKVPLEALPGMEESPIIQAFVKAVGTGDLQPGQVKNRNTAAERSRDWSLRDLDQLEKVRFIPNENIPVTFNGITAYLQADVEVELPYPFYDIYRDHKKAMRQADIADAYRMGTGDQLPDPMWQADEAALVRAWSIQGRPYGRPGGTRTTGLIITGDSDA